MMIPQPPIARPRAVVGTPIAPYNTPLQRAYHILTNTDGYADFRLNQRDIIGSLLQDHDVLALMPTGGGKSLCYQLSALMLPHLTLVVSPLLALMQDQLAFLQRHGIAAASIDSAQSREGCCRGRNEPDHGRKGVQGREFLRG